jgi:hypothetical protein
MEDLGRKDEVGNRKAENFDEELVTWFVGCFEFGFAGCACFFE